MRALPTVALDALKARNVTMRDFLWLEARNRTTGDPFTYGLWSDLGWINAQVINPRSGLTVSRDFEGAGGVVQISQVPMTNDLTVQTVSITLSQIANTNDLMRQYELKQARVEIYRGLFTPASLVQLAPAYARFVGFVDNAEVATPAEGGEGGIELTCVSHSQEMSRFNPATRSDAYTRRRDPTDSFSRHAAAVGAWDMVWGNAQQF